MAKSGLAMAIRIKKIKKTKIKIEDKNHIMVKITSTTIRDKHCIIKIIKDY